MQRIEGNASADRSSLGHGAVLLVRDLRIGSIGIHGIIGMILGLSGFLVSDIEEDIVRR
jgi:hypothetical protein